MGVVRKCFREKGQGEGTPRETEKEEKRLQNSGEANSFSRQGGRWSQMKIMRSSSQRREYCIG